MDSLKTGTGSHLYLSASPGAGRDSEQVLSKRLLNGTEMRPSLCSKDMSGYRTDSCSQQHRPEAGCFIPKVGIRRHQICLKGSILDLDDSTRLPNLIIHPRILELGPPDSLLCFMDLRLRGVGEGKRVMVQVDGGVEIRSKAGVLSTEPMFSMVACRMRPSGTEKLF